MSWVPPWNVVCPRCYAGKGKVCRSPYSLRSLGKKCHSDRWNKSIFEPTIPRALGPSVPKKPPARSAAGITGKRLPVVSQTAKQR